MYMVANEHFCSVLFGRVHFLWDVAFRKTLSPLTSYVAFRVSDQLQWFPPVYVNQYLLFLLLFTSASFSSEFSHTLSLPLVHVLSLSQLSLLALPLVEPLVFKSAAS